MDPQPYIARDCVTGGRRMRAWLIRVAGILVWLPAVAWAQLLASGDVTDSGAVLWLHAPAAGDYTFEVAQDHAFKQVVARLPASAQEANGLNAQALAEGLKPATRYHYRVIGKQGAGSRSGTFTTAPAPSSRARLKLLFGADLGGQGYGRLRDVPGVAIDGWPIFKAMSEEKADLFVALGDMLYSDRPITAEAPDFPKGNDFQIPKPGPGHVSNVADFRRDWHYHRSDHRYARFLEMTPLLATWDDHEIVNDAGGPEMVIGPTAEELARDGRLKQGDPSRPRGEHMPWSSTTDPAGRRRSVFFNPELYRAGRQVMFEFNPIRVLADPAARGERRLYRSVRWGKHAEIIMLDTRSYRDPRYRFDSETQPKTMLGAEQKRWFKALLESSDATWKIIVSSTPLATDGGNERDPQGRYYRDSWANGGDDNPYGYERELREITEFLRARKLRNVIFLTGDHHYSNLYAYDPDGDGTPDFYEANIGPLRAGPSKGRPVDRTFNPKVLFSDAGKATFAYGALVIDAASGRLEVEVRGVDGATVPGARLVLEPREPPETKRP